MKNVTSVLVTSVALSSVNLMAFCATNSETQKAMELESRRTTINYCLQNVGKSTKSADLEKTGKDILIAPRITYGIIAWQYALYGDYVKAAEYSYIDWVNYRQKGIWEPLDEGSVMDHVIEAYEKAGMYKELADFYPQANKENMERLSIFTDTQLLQKDFAAYKSRWPEEAEDYREFMAKWKKARKLAKTSNPKPLDSAVQHHEWFYSDKQDKILKSLAYYSQHNVRFMLEKALAHKDRVVSAKAKEYLKDLE